VLKVLSRINRWYLDDMRRGEVVEDLEVTREDFARVTDVIPVSDPHIFSETQRMAQTQAVMAMMEKNPDLFNKKVVIERFLKQIKVPGINELMVDTPAPVKIDAANENVAMAMGQSAYAYIEQDHLAHIQVILDFATNPVLGANPAIAPTYLPRAIDHIKQHLTLWYLNRMNGYVDMSMEGATQDYEMSKQPSKIDKLFSAVSQHVRLDSDEALQKVMPMIQQMMQQLQQAQPQPPMAPDTKVLLDTSMAETQRRTQRDQAEMGLKEKELQAKVEMDMKKLEQQRQLDMEELQLRLAIAEGDQETKQRIETARLTRDAAKLNFEQNQAVQTQGVPYGDQ
jgi:hypothetical protein